MSRITFKRKPMPIYAGFRPLFKICQILLILDLASRAKSSSLIRLHLFVWILKDDQRKEMLLNIVKEKLEIPIVWGIEPSVNFALQFAIAEGFIIKSGVSYKLSPVGMHFLKNSNAYDLFSDETIFLNKIGSKITEKMVDTATNLWK
ncbi:hypothetical protein K1N90_000520 [Salmonella enterica]|nr:hypothetical protein [Salmonella enterica]EHU4529457.1 hypothetical protein [Salmonella enterica]EHW0100320.1 hypothetical protein [Salmonella enterica]EHW1029370.1 hypothetical protein [Salmonella enterica]EHW9506051.1 hypothetical protein [Salmonella enterica]EHY7379494.1 hypothetical protein [Salmonella enterica]